MPRSSRIQRPIDDTYVHIYSTSKIDKTVAMIESRTLAEQVFEVLETAILKDEIPQGTELSEVELAEQYGVSRGPVREALRKLGAAGLVSLTPRRPAIVRILSMKEILDAYQVREALEQLAVRIATPLLTDDHMRDLEAMMEQMESAVEQSDIDGFFEANATFHRIFIDASDNYRLQETHSHVSRPMARYRRRSLKLRGNLRSSLLEHENIMEAIRERDADRAAELVREHIHVPQDRLEELSDEAWREMSGVDASDNSNLPTSD